MLLTDDLHLCTSLDDDEQTKLIDVLIDEHIVIRFLFLLHTIYSTYILRYHYQQLEKKQTKQ
jgi:hypothetical protein